MSERPATEYPTPFQKRTLWNAATGVSLLVLGILLVGLVWLTGKVFSFLQPVLVPILVAGIVAYVLDPVVRLLEKRGMSRLWAVITVFAALFTAIVILIAAILPGMRRAHGNMKDMLRGAPAAATAPAALATEQQESARLESAFERELRRLDEHNRGNPVGWLLTETDAGGSPVARAEGDPPRALDSFARSRAGRMVFEYKGAILNTLRVWVTAGSTRILGFLGLMLGLILVPVYLFFFLKDSAAIRLHWHDYVPLKASHFKTELVETLQEINGYLISFFRGQVLVAAIDGLLVGIALTAFGLPYGFVIGIFMAVLGVIPYVGNILCLIPACLIAYLHSRGSSPFGMEPWAYVSCVVGIFLVVQQVNSLVTAPKIVGDSVGLHPLTVIFSMLFWSVVLGGFVGALLAVPLTAAIKVLFRRFIWVRRIHPAGT
jgi:predicted PurR-regulated permease PerM